jgi:hypothetical protein
MQQLCAASQSKYPATAPKPVLSVVPMRMPVLASDLGDGAADYEEQRLRGGILLRQAKLNEVRGGATVDNMQSLKKLDTAVVRLVQAACRRENPTRALDLTRWLHMNQSIGLCIRVAE